MTDRLVATADGIDRLIAAIGRAVAWLALFVVLVQFAVVVLRYAFGIGSIWLSESVIYGHAALFMLAAAWTLQVGGHVRVDIFYADASPRTKAMVDLVGALILLLPFMAVIAWFAVPYVARSWAIVGTLARDQRAAVRLSAQDVDSAVRAADGAAGRVAGDPRGACARRTARHPAMTV